MQINERFVSVALLIPASGPGLGGLKARGTALITRALMTCVKLETKRIGWEVVVREAPRNVRLGSVSSHTPRSAWPPTPPKVLTPNLPRHAGQRQVSGLNSGSNSFLFRGRSLALISSP